MRVALEVESIGAIGKLTGFGKGPGMFRFEKFEVWQRAIQLADAVYTITRSFPDSERFGLTGQMRRAAVSVSSNIAEGSSRASDKDFARFVEIAYGSLLEVVSQAFIARNQKFLPATEFDALYADTEQLARMLSGLQSRLSQQ
jgi:four helix bundle protein